MLFHNHVEDLDKTAAKHGRGHTSDDDIEVVPTLLIGADVPRCGAVIPATRGGSTVWLCS
jgi:hypothetical protein